ncbi:MAG: hypothetical protein EOP05_04700 [Proteobacteria bacterium]|nr:MAG: hypothetical protein EOP05_04700 [Pseudomonadota bacterium]
MAKNLDVALKVAEAHQEREMNSKISQRMRASVSEGGPNSVRATVLSMVANENYAKAVEELRAYVESRNEFPQFRFRAERYLAYAVDLINAIKAKRSFPGVQHLSMSKQQELHDRAMEHFEDLKVTLRKVDHIDKEVKLDDVRSTVWVVKALIYSVFAVLVLGFLLELSKGVLPAATIVVDDGFGRLINFAFDKLGL